MTLPRSAKGGAASVSNSSSSPTHAASEGNPPARKDIHRRQHLCRHHRWTIGHHYHAGDQPGPGGYGRHERHDRQGIQKEAFFQSGQPARLAGWMPRRVGSRRDDVLGERHAVEAELFAANGDGPHALGIRDRALRVETEAEFHGDFPTGRDGVRDQELLRFARGESNVLAGRFQVFRSPAPNISTERYTNATVSPTATSSHRAIRR